MSSPGPGSGTCGAMSALTDSGTAFEDLRRPGTRPWLTSRAACHDGTTGRAARMASFALWPFGRTIVDKPGPRPGALIGNVLWVVLCGVWLAIGHLVTAFAMAITIIGIPLALANLKLIPVSLMPLGKVIVPVDEARVAA